MPSMTPSRLAALAAVLFLAGFALRCAPPEGGLCRLEADCAPRRRRVKWAFGVRGGACRPRVRRARHCAAQKRTSYALVARSSG